MTWTVWHYAGCSTCKSALRWLRAQGIPFDALSIVEQPPSPELLRVLWLRSRLPLERFFNISGNAYRAGDFKARLPAMSDEQKLQALSHDGMLIRRPLVDTGEGVLLGFKEEEWRGAR